MKSSSPDNHPKVHRSLTELSSSSERGLAPPSSGALVGHVIDNIRIESVLGSGRTAFVYRGTDLVLQRPVALKVLRSPSAAAAFDELLVEARQLAKLTHPNLLKIYQVMRHEGQSCLVLELADAGPLSQRTNGDHRPVWPDVLRWCSAAARGLASAHAQGIVHCDVKPSNLLLFGDGRCVVADFGLSRHAQPDEATLGFVGTPLYASPEVIRRAPPSPASDQYSLAATVWHLLTGSPPFYAPTDRAILSLHVSGRLPSLSASVPDLPPAASAAIKKALAKSPSDRFECIEALAQHFDDARRSHRRAHASIPSAGTSTAPRDRASSAALPVMRELSRVEPGDAPGGNQAASRADVSRVTGFRRRALVGLSVGLLLVLATAGAYMGASFGTSRKHADQPVLGATPTDPPQQLQAAATSLRPAFRATDYSALLKLAVEQPGSEVVVRGTVWSTDESASGKSIRVLFGPKDDAGTFHVVVYSDAFTRLKELGNGTFAGLVGQKVEIEGNLREYKGFSRIIVRDGGALRRTE
jgi:hypothetical protein